MGGQRRIGAELQQPSRDVHGRGNDAFPLALGVLAQVDEDDFVVRELV